MEYRRRLHLTLISAKGLKNHHSSIFGKSSDTYAVVSTTGNKLSENAVFTRTASEENAGTDPQWYYFYPMEFVVEEAVLQRNESTIVIKIKGVRKYFGSIKLGQVKVPVKQLLTKFEGKTKRIKFKLKNASGKLNGGVVTFSYKFGEKFKSAPYQSFSRFLVDSFLNLMPRLYGRTEDDDDHHHNDDYDVDVDVVVYLDVVHPRRLVGAAAMI